LDEKEKASWPLMLAWRKRLDLGHWMMPWKMRKHS